MDTTIIEIFPDNDNISKSNFLEIDENASQDEESLKNFYEKKFIYLLGYPEGGNAKVSYGVLQELNKDRINHLCSTKEGSSGSPILLSDSSKLIGIHFGNPKSINFHFNYGTFIKYPFINFLNNKEDKLESSSNFNNINDINLPKDKIIHLDSTNIVFIFNKVETIVELSGILKYAFLNILQK